VYQINFITYIAFWIAAVTKLKHVAENGIERRCYGKYIGRAPAQSKSLVTVPIVSTIIQAEIRRQAVNGI
jgi:hypothetical protein